MGTESTVSKICPHSFCYHHQYPPGQTQLNLQRGVSSVRLPPPRVQGFPSATVMASKLVFLEKQPGPRPTLVQSCLEGVSTADTVPRPGQAAPPWPGLLGEVMPSPAALPRRKRLEVACFQEQRGKRLGGRGHSSRTYHGWRTGMAGIGTTSP